MKKKIAVIGGGVYGITISLGLSKNYYVDLFEKEKDILQAASGINQLRLHRGYHYPRSPETVISAIKSEKEFSNRFPQAIINNEEKYYAISKKKSLISGKDFINFLQKYKLEYKLSDLKLLNKNSIELCVKVKEKSINPFILHDLLWKQLRNNNVNVFLNTKVTKEIFNKYDFVVICTYSNLNELLPPQMQSEYQFELCEKIVLDLPSEFENKGIVVMDGPFMCVDSYGTTGSFIMGNVVHAIHKSNIGKFPIFDSKYKKFLNSGIIKKPSKTNYKRFIKSAIKFIPLIEKAKYIGSMYTFRCLLPYKESTDERLHAIKIINKKLLTVFSSKIANSVECATTIKKIIDSKV